MPTDVWMRVPLLFAFLVACGDPRFEAGRTHERAGEWDEAVEAYAEAIRTYPNHFEAARRTAQVECYRRKDVVECRRWAIRLRSLEPDPAAARRLILEADYLEGRARYLAGSYAEARRHFADVVERDPTHARAHFLDGRAAERLGRVAEALRAYGRAVKARPSWDAPNEARRRLAGR